jgi:hypothetical protein
LDIVAVQLEIGLKRWTNLSRVHPLQILDHSYMRFRNSNIKDTKR